MLMSRTSSAAKRRYNPKTYDTAHAFLRKGQLAYLKQIAADHDTSVSTLIIVSLTKYLKDEFGVDFNDFPEPTQSDE